MIKKYIKEIMIVIALIIGVSLHDGSTFIGWLGTVGLLAGFANVYLTTKRSEWFLIPDMIWIVTSIWSLFLTNNYSDMLLYIFYIFVGIYQFVEWKNNKDSNNKTIIKRLNKEQWMPVIGSLTILLMVIISFTYGTSNVVLGAITSAFGIVGAVVLAKRFYESEQLFFVSNVSSVIVLSISGLYQLALIPMVFAIFSIIFLIENRKKDNINKGENPFEILKERDDY